MVTVRAMTTEDIKGVSELMCSCYRWLGVKEGFSHTQVNFLVGERGSIDRITADSQCQTYFVACMDTLIVGVVAINGNEIAKLFVDPACHGQGIGTKLFNTAQKMGADNVCEEMIVGVMACSAIGFYEKQGMVKFSEKKLDSGAFSGRKVPMMRKILIHK